MKKLSPLLILAFMAVLAFQACKTKENLTDNNSNKTTGNQTANNDTIKNKNINNTIVIENNTDSTKNNTVQEKSTKDTILNVYVVPEEDLIDYDPPIEQQMTAPMPKIVTDLFPDYEWKLFVDNEGYNKYYSTYVGNRIYGYDVLNDLVASKYKKGEISDEQLIKLYISLLFHPYDPNLEIGLTKHEENTMHLSFNKYRSSSTYNYKTVIVYKGEQVEFYSLVKDNKYLGCMAVKNGRMIKQLTVN
jgi:hypothetical protein